MKRYIYILIGIILLLAVLLIIRGEEDTWICQNGKWIRHGNPSSVMPTKICK